MTDRIVEIIARLRAIGNSNSESRTMGRIIIKEFQELLAGWMDLWIELYEGFAYPVSSIEFHLWRSVTCSEIVPWKSGGVE